jgi:hypothetical protein
MVEPKVLSGKLGDWRSRCPFSREIPLDLAAAGAVGTRTKSPAVAAKVRASDRDFGVVENLVVRAALARETRAGRRSS